MMDASNCPVDKAGSNTLGLQSELLAKILACHSNCRYCFAKGVREFIEGQHKAQCLQYPVPCPDECGMNIPRKNVIEHKNVCLSVIVDCEYHAMGCEYKASRGSMENHYKENVSQHLSLTRDLLQLVDKSKLQEFITTSQNLKGNMLILLSKLT